MRNQHRPKKESNNQNHALQNLRAKCKDLSPNDRCRAMALGARDMPDESACRSACSDAVKAARQETDMYRCVRLLREPIGTLLSRGLVADADKLASFAIELSDSVIPSNSRGEALLNLESIPGLDLKYRKMILRRLFILIDSKPGWRIARACAYISRKFDQEGESAFVDQLLSACKNEWILNRIQRDRLK